MSTNDKLRKNTMTFDFATKYTVFNNNMAKGSYSGCKGAGLLGMGKGKYAVTFIDNHDTYQRGDGNEYTGDILRANAYLLSMPGVPFRGLSYQPQDFPQGIHQAFPA